MKTPIRKFLTATAGAALLAGMAATQAEEGNTNKTATAADQGAERLQQWSDMREEAVSAEEILRGNFSNGFNPVGQVENLVLSADATKIQYVIYETNAMPWAYYVGDGYVPYSDVDLDGTNFGTVTVTASVDEKVPGPETLRITADEADYRLVSRVVDASMIFNGNQAHQIEDLLVDPESGLITHYVVGTQTDALFSDDRRTVPATHVRVKDGQFITNLDFENLEDMQDFESEFL